LNFLLNKTQVNLFVFSLILIFSVPRVANALDVYSFIENDCAVHSGFIVGDEDLAIHLLSLEGIHEKVPKANIATIVIFSTLQNPIRSINLDPSLTGYAKEVYINDDNKPLFTGWPIRYIEDLIIFYDTLGKTHVLELSEITSIKDVKPSSEKINIVESKPLVADFKDVNSRCSSLNSKKREGVGPTRIINDKISVADFLSNFEKGYRKVNSYQERTHFYAKPFLFEKRSKLGLLVFSRYDENPPILPGYFQWSTGKPYGFQTFDIFGSSPSELLPTGEPVTAFQSKLKSHFFNASFIGNIAALPAGSSYYYNSTATVSGQSPFTRDAYVGNGFNYIAMMGADYGPYSLAFGTYYPTYAFRTRTLDSNGTGTETVELREVLAASLSSMFKASYTKNRFNAHFVYAPLSQSSGSQSDDTKLKKIFSYNSVAIDSFQASTWFLRGGVDVTLTDDLKIGVDEIFSQSRYSELQGTKHYYFNDSHYTTSAYVSQSFGYYISVKVLFNLFDRSDDYIFPNLSGNTSGVMTTSYGGAFEFVF
jgi:hypothetical protein